MPSPVAPYFSEGVVTFPYRSGRDAESRSENSRSLIASIEKLAPKASVLEVSTSSNRSLGVRLSALNLLVTSNWGTNTVERTFQASKIFEHGGPFLEILRSDGNPKSLAKLSNSGRLIGFRGPDGIEFKADGTSTFYDRIYLSALIQNPKLLEELVNFDIFTDLRFPKRVLGFAPNQPINTQARSCAIAKSLFVQGGLANVTQFLSRESIARERPEEPNYLFGDWD